MNPYELFKLVYVFVRIETLQFMECFKSDLIDKANDSFINTARSCQMTQIPLNKWLQFDHDLDKLVYFQWR